MREAKKKRLRDAWHGPLTAEQIARSSALGEKTLRRFWAQEKEAGRLPDGPRPHFVARSKVATTVELGIDRDLALDDAEPNPSCETQCLASLEAIRAHHADIDNAEAHTVPREWLRFDGKGVLPPTHAMLMAMCRAHDQRVRA